VTAYADLVTVAGYRRDYKRLGSEAYELRLLRDFAPGSFTL
jgi:hypothetical protein